MAFWNSFESLLRRVNCPRAEKSIAKLIDGKLFDGRDRIEVKIGQRLHTSIGGRRNGKWGGDSVTFVFEFFANDRGQSFKCGIFEWLIDPNA